MTTLIIRPSGRLSIPREHFPDKIGLTGTAKCTLHLRGFHERRQQCASSTKSVTRKAARPADRPTKGSTGARLVHAIGKERRSPYASW